MKKRVTIRKKTAWAFATTALLIALITAVLTGVGLRVAQKREADKNRLKLDALSKMLTNEKRI